MKRDYFKVTLILVFLIVVTSFASALTGKIGNARAIVEAEVGDTLDRTILVINDNDIPVIVEMFPSGDLEQDIEVLDTNFTLQPGEQKKARFEVYVSQSGTTNTNINVKFTGVGEKQGVGMSSTLIVKATGEDLFGNSPFDDEPEDFMEQDTLEPTESDNPYGGDTGEFPNSRGSRANSGMFVFVIVLVALAGIILIAFIVSIKKEGRKSRYTQVRRTKRRRRR